MCQNTEGSAKFIYGWLDKYYDGENGQERTFKRENQRYWILRERERSRNQEWSQPSEAEWLEIRESYQEMGGGEGQLAWGDKTASPTVDKLGFPRWRDAQGEAARRQRELWDWGLRKCWVCNSTRLHLT